MQNVTFLGLTLSLSLTLSWVQGYANLRLVSYSIKQFMKTRFLNGCFVWCIFTISAYGQNPTPTNPGAESGDFTGWDANTVSYGANQEPDPLNSPSINADPLFVTEGSNSFHLHDGSGGTALRLTSAPGHRVVIVSDIDYVLSFDALIIGNPAYPLFQARFFNSPVGGINLAQMAFNLGDPGSFSEWKPVTNGFTRYILDIQNSSGGFFAFQRTTYLELDYFTDFYGNTLSDLYLDNIRVSIKTLPLIQTINLSSTNVIVSGTNGLPGEAYYLMATTNLAVPLTNWISVATNVFKSEGNFACTNAIPPEMPLRFFSLRVVR